MTESAPPYPGGPQAPQGPPPSNNLVWAILTTILCCLPFGIVAIVQAAKVNGLWAQGQTAAAQEAADSAKKWSIIAGVVGIVVLVLYVILLVAGVMTLGTMNTTTTP